MEQIENLNEQQPKSNNKKKKTLLIILLLLLFVIIGLAIALPLVLIKDDKAEIVDLRLSKNTFNYGEAYLTTPVFVIYDDDSQKEITLLDTNLSQEDSAKFLIIGQHQITMTYDDFIKGETITVTEAEFTSQEIAALVYSDHVVEFTGEGYFFPVTNLPDGASVTYTIDEIVQNATSYSLIESGSYEVEATISKQNYRDYQLTFSVTIVDTSITIEGFNQEGDLFSTTVSSQTDSINFEEIVSVAGEGNFDIYSDGELENILDKSNISLTAGENTFYLKVYFDNNNIEHVYTITINKSSMLSVTYLLNGIELDKVFVEENGSISQPNYQKEGYIILGWQRNGEDITFPYLVTEDAVLNAVYTLENYDILLNLAEGIIEGEYKQSYTVEDESFTLPIPQREGYIFLGWSGTGLESPTLSVTIEQGSAGDREYTANWEIKKFTVTWENEDGSELEVDQNVEWGSMPSYDGETPTKESTAQYDYEFAGWSPEISEVSGDITYTATFTPVLRSYSVTFGEGVTVIVDGEPIISGQEIEYGKTLTISYTESEGYHKTSFKVNGQEQTSPYQHEVTSAVTIEYSEEINVYTVTLPSGTGYSIESDTTSVNHGSDFKFKVVLSEGYTESQITVKANDETLVLGDDGYYTITNVTDNITVTIEGVELNRYTITWKNGEKILETDENVEWNTMPSYDGETPTKESTAQYDYEFAGWSPEVSVVSGDITYTATFTPVLRSYSVTFGEGVTVIVDGEPIISGQEIEYGKTLTISYTESEGYHKTSFKVNGQEQTSPYQHEVTSAVTIEYSEEINVYTVTLPSGTGYSIESDTTSVNHGSDFKFKVVLSEGYTKSQITVKANDETLVLGDDGYYTITNVTESKTITIEGVVLNTYTIIWNNWDGTELTRDEVTHGEMPSYDGETPTKESTAQYDYEFTGWDPEVAIASEDTSYTAQYQASIRSYQVTFNSNGGSDVDSITKEYGSEIGALPQPTKEGHAFEGWFTDLSAGEEINEGTLVTGDVTYYAHWSVNNYSVTTSPATNGSISASPNADYGTEVTITVSEEEGYTLSNLYYNYDGNEDPISIDIKTTISTTYSFTMPAGNVTIHAEFAQIIDEWLFYEDMVMSYIGPDGDMATIPSSYSSRGNVEIKELKFETSQDYFDYVRNNSQELSKVMLQMIKLTIEDQVYENLTPYEYMRIMEQDDAFDSNNDPNTVINVTMEYVSYDNIIFYVGEETTVSEISSLTFLNTENQSYANIDHLNIPATIENIGDETFSEWGRSIYIFTIESADVYTGLISTESNVMGGLLGRAKIIRVPTTIVGSYENSYLNNETLYTKTTDNDYTVFTLKYTVTFNSNGGSDVDSIQVPYNTAIGELPVPTKEGYEFAGWFTDLSGGEKITEDTVITTNVTYYAKWNLIDYNITLNLMGGGVSGEYKQTYTILDSNFDLPVPTKEGHEFLGWTGEGIEEPTITVTIVQGTTGDLEYTANWKINQYTYTFYRYESGDILKQETVDYGSEIVAPTDVIRASDSIKGINYTFLAWDKEVSTIGAGDIEFYATWSEENFSTNLNFVYSTLDGYYIVDKGSCQESEVIVPSSFTTLENGKAGVCEVAANGFASTNMTSITFNGQITAIGEGAFANSSVLTIVSGLDHLYTIPANAFSGCSALTSFTIGESVIIVGSNAFSGAGLTSIYIPASVVSIENGAFEGCPIASFSVSEDNRNYASFEGNLYNKNLTELILYAAGQNASTFSVPNFVSAIGDYAFGNNNDLLNRSAASVGALQNIIIPTNVTSLKDFSLNNSLTVYTNFSSKPSTWSEASIANNTVYWQDEWQLVENEPTLTISPSAFKTGVYQNWMSYLSDETLLVDVVMPGSHDAGTMGISASNLHTQSSGFYDQLTGGVRYFDMRVAEYNGTVRCIHANSGDPINSTNGTGIEFETVLSDMLRFVNENPSEIIILDFQHLWNDFESQVVPMIEERLTGKMLTKDKAKNYLNLTMGQLRNWGVNFIVIVQDDSNELKSSNILGETVSAPNFDGYDWMYKRTENLRSEYDGDTHRSSASDLIGIWPTYFNNFTENQYNKIFILQTQLTSGDLVSREKSIRNDANKYFRGLKNNATNLAKVNVIMRDFVVDDLSGVDSAQSCIQSVIFLNVYKNQIKETELERFKLLIDFDTVDSWATA